MYRVCAAGQSLDPRRNRETVLEKVAKEHVKMACFTLETRYPNERSFDMKVGGAGTANSMNQQMNIMMRISACVLTNGHCRLA